MNRGAVIRAIAAIGLLAAAGFLASSASENFMRDLTKLNRAGLVIAGFFMALATMVAVERLRQTGRIFRQSISARDSAMALSLGHFASAIIVQVVGQVAARTAWLARCGVPVIDSAMMYVVERIAAATVCFAFACLGTGWLFGARLAELIEATAGVWIIPASVALGFGALSLGLWLVMRHAKLKALMLMHLPAMLPVVVLTILMQTLTFAAWMTILNDLPGITAIDVAAGVAIVMFGASVPIGVAGWGPRELSAVAILGLIGVPEVTALAAAVGMGIVSLAAISILGLWAALTAKKKADSDEA